MEGLPVAMIAAAVPVTKATRRAPNPDGRAMRRMEADAETRIYDALQKWGRALFRGVEAETIGLLLIRLDDPQFNRPIRDALIAVLQDVASAGADFGREQVEAAFYGTAKNVTGEIGAVDWTAANADALEWATSYGYQLIRGINDTTRRIVAGEVRYFVDNSITINQLRDRLMASAAFSRSRAQRIAVTEVTRAYAEGNMAAWKASGVVEGREWMTAVDELVCPMCAPLSGKVVRMGEPFPMAGMGPPRHVSCRCWLSPVVIGDMETF